jgi:hypothetical protein
MITGDHPSTAEGIAAELGLPERAPGPHRGPELEVDGRRRPRRRPRRHLGLRSGHPGPQGAHRRRLPAPGTGRGHDRRRRQRRPGHPLGRRRHRARRAQHLCSPGRSRPRGHSTAGSRRIIDAIVEGRAMWTSVREAIAVLVGGNLGEILFTVAGSARHGEAPLNARQLLFGQSDDRCRPRDGGRGVAPTVTPLPPMLLREGPDVPSATALNRLDRRCAALTGTSATTAAWLVARRHRPPQAGQTPSALVALVLTELGQTRRRRRAKPDGGRVEPRIRCAHRWCDPDPRAQPCLRMHTPRAHRMVTSDHGGNDRVDRRRATRRDDRTKRLRVLGHAGAPGAPDGTGLTPGAEARLTGPVGPGRTVRPVPRPGSPSVSRTG